MRTYLDLTGEKWRNISDRNRDGGTNRLMASFLLRISKQQFQPYENGNYEFGLQNFSVVYLFNVWCICVRARDRELANKLNGNTHYDYRACGCARVDEQPHCLGGRWSGIIVDPCGHP